MPKERRTPSDEVHASRKRLPAEQLYRLADLSALAFDTTADIKPIDGLIGQERALDAIRLGTGIYKPGFNLFAVGRPEARMRQAVEGVLKGIAPTRSVPGDWVYVNNFSDARRPGANALPAKRAPEFRGAMSDLIDDLKAALPAVFESEVTTAVDGA